MKVGGSGRRVPAFLGVSFSARMVVAEGALRGP